MPDVFRVTDRPGSAGTAKVPYVTLNKHAFPGDWPSEAPCRNGRIDPELFDPPDTNGAYTREKKMKQAIRHCQKCPVRLPCLATAVANNETRGVWGGLTPEKRRSLTPRQRANILATVQIASKKAA